MTQKRPLSPGEAAELHRALDRTIAAFAERLELDRTAVVEAVRLIVGRSRTRRRAR